MANTLVNFLADLVLQNKEVKSRVNRLIVDDRNKHLEAAKGEWADATAKTLGETIQKQAERKKYVFTTSREEFKASELSAGKNYKTLQVLTSNAPGSIQCINRIQEAVVGGGYVIERIKGERASNKDLKKIIAFCDQVNPDESIEDIVKSGLYNYLAYGNWYNEKVKNKRGNELKEIYTLNPAQMKILVDKNSHELGVDIRKGYEREDSAGRKIIYSLDEIIHIKRPSPTGSLYGEAVLEKNEATLQLLINAITYNINILKNGGRPPLQLILPPDSSEDDAEAVNAFWEKNYTGPANAGKTLITFKGAEAKPLGVTPEEMKYLDLLNYGLTQVAGQYGVPLVLIAKPEGTNRSTAAETRRAFYLTLIYPLRKALAHKLTQEIIVKGLKISGWKLDFRSAGLEESDATRRDTILAWSKGLYSWNESRVKMGSLPEKEPWADEYTLLGTKNDSLIKISDALGSSPSPDQSGDQQGNTPDNKPNSKSPNNKPDSPSIKPNRTQGEGADENPQ